MLSLTAANLGWYVAVPLVGYLVAKFLFNKDTEIENRRRAAANLAATLQAYGLKKTPEFLIDYSVGDYSGMAVKIAKLAELFASGEKHVVEELDAVYERVLAAKLATEEGRALIAAKLGDSVQPTDSTVVKTAPKATVSA